MIAVIFLKTKAHGSDQVPFILKAFLGVPIYKEIEKDAKEITKIEGKKQESIPAEDNRSDLQNKFNEWFKDSVSADPPPLAEANHLIVEPPISAEANPSTVASFLRKFIVALKNIRLRAKASYLSLSLFIGMSTIGLLFTVIFIPPGVAALQSSETATATSTIRPPTSTYTPTPTSIKPTLTAIVTSTSTPTITAPTPTVINMSMVPL